MIDNFKEFKELLDLFYKMHSGVIDEDLEIDGTKISLHKDGKDLSIHITSDNEEFDDTGIKEIVDEYKTNIDKLDDCLFVSALEDMDLDAKRFDELLNKDSFTEEEADEVEEMINHSVEVIKKHIADKMDELVDVYNRL